jgi:ABC-type antimicrobial peptide transport system permease subunit
MSAERVPESPRLARLLRYTLRHFTFGRCFYTFLVVLLITTVTVFLHYIDLWSVVPILVVASSMMVIFLLGFIAGNVPIQRASRLQVLHRPSAK